MSNKKCRIRDPRGLERGTRGKVSGVSKPEQPSRMSELIEAIDTVIYRATSRSKNSEKK